MLEVSSNEVIREFYKTFEIQNSKFTMNNKKQPPKMFYKKAILKNFSIFTGKCLCSSPFLIDLRAFRSVKKEIPMQEFFWEYCEIFKKAFLEENL